MNRFLRYFFLIIVILLVILWLIAHSQQQRQAQLDQEQATADYTLAVERIQADLLVNRLESLKTQRETLLLPQVELSLKL